MPYAKPTEHVRHRRHDSSPPESGLHYSSNKVLFGKRVKRPARVRRKGCNGTPASQNEAKLDGSKESRNGTNEPILEVTVTQKIRVTA
jgi:hypothetical protein